MNKHAHINSTFMEYYCKPNVFFPFYICNDIIVIVWLKTQYSIMLLLNISTLINSQTEISWLLMIYLFLQTPVCHERDVAVGLYLCNLCLEVGKSIENIKQYLFIIRLINKQIFAVKKSHEIVNKHEKMYRSVLDKTYLTKYQILLQKYK